jgi:hypothetical protein
MERNVTECFTSWRMHPAEPVQDLQRRALQGIRRKQPHRDSLNVEFPDSHPPTAHWQQRLLKQLMQTAQKQRACTGLGDD